MAGQDLAARSQGAADDLGEIDQLELRLDRAGFQPRHVEQVGDEAVQPLGFLLDRAEQLAPASSSSNAWR